MATNDLIKVAIGVTVGIILITGMIWPTISDYADGNTYEFTNSDTSNLITISDDPSSVNLTITYTAGDRTVSVNGVAQPVGQYHGAFFVSDNFWITAGYSNSALSVSGYTDSQSGVLMQNPTTVSITVVNGVTTVTADTETFTATASNFIGWADASGTHKQYRNNDAAADTDYYFNTIDQIYVVTNINTNSLGFAWAHGLVGQIAGNDLSLVMNSDAVEGYENLNKFRFGQYYFDDTQGTNANGTNFIPYVTLLPATVYAYDDASAPNVHMLMIVGLMCVLLLVVLVARNLNMRG